RAEAPIEVTRAPPIRAAVPPPTARSRRKGRPPPPWGWGTAASAVCHATGGRSRAGHSCLSGIRRGVARLPAPATAVERRVDPLDEPGHEQAGHDHPPAEGLDQPRGRVLHG